MALDTTKLNQIQFYSGFRYAQVLKQDEIDVTLTSTWPTAQLVASFTTPFGTAPQFDVQFLYGGQWLPIGEAAIASVTATGLYLTQISGSSLHIRYWIYNLPIVS